MTLCSGLSLESERQPGVARGGTLSFVDAWQVAAALYVEALRWQADMISALLFPSAMRPAGQRERGPRLVWDREQGFVAQR